MFTVRKLTIEDAGDVAALECAIFPDAYGKENVESSVGADYALSLGAFRGGKLLGYLLGTCIADEAEVLRIATESDERRAGIGEGLLTAFTAEANNKGAKCVYLEVRADNLPALALYRKLQFRQEGVRRDYYKNPKADACLLKLSLE